MAIIPFDNAPFGPQRGANKSDRQNVALLKTRNFDISKPAGMVLFLHGHGATVQRDVVERQKVLQQLEKAGINGVLVAPQLAYNAKSSKAGRFTEPGFANKFLDEAAMKLTTEHDARLGRPSAGTINTFKNMPIIMVSYSGGYRTAANILQQAMATPPSLDGSKSNLNARIKGVVLLDSLYGNTGTFKDYANQTHKPFLISTYIGKNSDTAIQNRLLKNSFPSFSLAPEGALVTDRHNISIYHSRHDVHRSLVKNALATVLKQVPGYRNDAAPVPAAKSSETPTAQPNWRKPQDVQLKLKASPVLIS